MLHWLAQTDTNIFLLLNGLHSPWLDQAIFVISQKGWVWLPLYAYLFFRVWNKYKSRSLPVLLSMILLVVIADQTASALCKPFFARLRPTHNESIQALVHVVNGYRGGLYGFPSSHAANTFGLALIAGLIFRRRLLTIILLSWSCLIAYSRIYLGVHYPGDVLGGFAIGAISALLVYVILKVAYQKMFRDDLHHPALR